MHHLYVKLMGLLQVSKNLLSMSFTHDLNFILALIVLYDILYHTWAI